ncbi:hypothetical protein JCM9279_003600 [Rhodotorula babjevae]
MAERPEKDEYHALEMGPPAPGRLPYVDSPDRRASTSTLDDDNYDDLDEQGHASIPSDAPAKRGTASRTPLVLVAALAAFALFALGTALALVPSFRQALLPSSSPSLARVERNLSVSLNDYLHARFDADKHVVAFTMATGEPNYVPQARNWDAKRAELGMDDTVVVLCLDAACLDECERGGLRAFGAYLVVDLPPPTSRRDKRGKERGHRLAYLKFLAMLEMAQSGFPSLFFEGDTFLTADPYPHMLSLSDDSWDLQFTEDIGYVVNFGWILARSSTATVAFWQRALDAYLKKNEWDQLLLSGIVRAGARESRGENGDEHWWFLDDLNLRISMLPLSTFRATHVEMLNWYTPEADELEPVMNHLTAVTFPNRQFYPKERGWATDLDSFYSRRRPVLASGPLNGTIHEVLRYARSLYVLSAVSGRALLLPDDVTVHGVQDGTPYSFSRTFTRFVGIEQAVNDLDLLEPAFFAHAAKYLGARTLAAWSSSRTQLALSSFANPLALLAAIRSSEEDVVVLDGWSDGNARKWTLEEFPAEADGADVDGEVVRALKGAQGCQGFHIDHLPFPHCQPLSVPVP